MNQHHATHHPFVGEDYNHHAMQMNVNDSNNDNDNGEYNTMMMMNNDDDLLAFSSSSSHAGASSMMHSDVEDGGHDANNGTMTTTDSSILDRMSNTNPTSGDNHDYLDDNDKGNEEDGVMGREEEENDGDIENAHHGAFQDKESQDDDHENEDDEEEIDETWTRWKDDAGKKLQSALEDYKGHTKRLFTEIESYITKLANVDKSYASVQQSENAETSRLDQVAPDVEGATGPVLNHHLHHQQQQRHHHD